MPQPAVNQSDAARFLRALRSDGYNKENRRIKMRTFFAKRLPGPPSFRPIYSVWKATLSAWNSEKRLGNKAGYLLGKRNWSELELLIRQSPKRFTEKFVNIVYLKSREFQRQYFACYNCSSHSLDRNEVDGQLVCGDCISRAEVAQCGHKTFRMTSVIIHDSLGIISHTETKCKACLRSVFYWEIDGRHHTIPAPPVVVGNYHSSRDKIDRIGKSIPGLQDIGFELEWGPIPATIERRNEISEELNKLESIVAGVEQDGSISGINGAEIVTHYGSMDAVLSGATKIAAALKGKARSHNTTCCGLHVSISRAGLTNLDIARFVVFWNNPKNTRFLVAFARRWSNTYCIQDFDKGNYKIPEREYDIDSFVWTGNSRYEIVNLCNNNRIEVRAFRGTTSRETLRLCISLCVWAMAYCKDSKCRKLHYSDFLNWCKTAKKTRGRRKFKPTDILAFAKRRGFLDDKKPEDAKPAQASEGSVPGIITADPIYNEEAFEATVNSYSYQPF